jgi:hypothetical protein
METEFLTTENTESTEAKGGMQDILRVPPCSPWLNLGW